jgi:BlaI family transcriptional regulator, penicillinase repressor
VRLATLGVASVSNDRVADDGDAHATRLLTSRIDSRPMGLSLTEPQLAVLRVIWAQDGATVPEVWRALHAERRLAQSTVATMMARLERRGLLERRQERRPDGMQYVYRATVTEDAVRAAMVRELTALLFGGEPSALVAHLAGGGQVRAQDLERARELLARDGEEAHEE